MSVFRLFVCSRCETEQRRPDPGGLPPKWSYVTLSSSPSLRGEDAKGASTLHLCEWCTDTFFDQFIDKKPGGKPKVP
jgi:hypothetical protein